MNKILQKIFVRNLLRMTSRQRSVTQTEKMLSCYLRFAEGVTDQTGRQRVEVPLMTGVDPDMRHWSFFMLLEHNSIVNRAMTFTVRRLARGEPLEAGWHFDPKKDVMPSSNPGEEQPGNFSESVQEHLRTLAELPGLRGTATYPHPLFGDFDAHMWNGMFWLHLKIHLRQAEKIVSSI